MRLRYVLPCILALTACGDDNSSTSVKITPATADVLTCSTQQFTTDDTATTAGAWSVTSSHGGSVDATGLYSSPLTVPAPADATIAYEPADGGKATATAHLATAHIANGVNITTGFTRDNAPFERVVQASGSRVYAVWVDTDSAVHVLVSNDGGATYTAHVQPNQGGTLNCFTFAIDAVNPDVIYVAYHLTVDSETAVVFSASSDGGLTFPSSNEKILADSMLDGLASERCPDIVSPSADHVIVTTARLSSDETQTWVATYVSPNRGTSFVSGKGNGSDDFWSASDTNTAHKFDDALPVSQGANGPRVFSDGKGHTCLAYAIADGSTCVGSNCVGIYTQCSSNSGTSWSAPFKISTSGALTYPTGAFSSSGKVAITWQETIGSDAQIMVVTSSDIGATWSAKTQYPFSTKLGFYTGFPVLAWQNEILWLAMTVDYSDDSTVVIDKTCDLGVSWSGAMVVTQPSQYLTGTLFVSSRGVFVTARSSQDSVMRPLTEFQLTP